MPTKERRSQKTKTYGYLPYNLSAGELTQKMKHFSNRTLIFYKVLFNYRRSTKKELLDHTEYVRLHSDYLKKIFGQGDTYKQVTEYMESSGLLEITPFFYNSKTGVGKCKGYRIPQRLLGLSIFGEDRLYRKVLIDDRKTYNAEQNYRRERLRKMSGGNDTLIRLAEGLEDLYLDLGSREARGLIQRHGWSTVGANGTSYLREMYLLNSREMEWFKQDDYGRFHHAWVTFRKAAHPLIRFRGFEHEAVVEKDIANSQPFFASIINPDTVARLLPEASPLLVGINFDTEHWREYRQVCLQGSFYEVMEEAMRECLGDDWLVQLQEAKQARIDRDVAKWEKQWQKNTELEAKGLPPKKNKRPKTKNPYRKAGERQAVKTAFYEVIFGTQRDSEGLEGKVFATRFPSVSEALKTIKSRYCAANPSKKNRIGKKGTTRGTYTNTSWLMQRLESKVMIETALRNLLDQGYDKLIPRHDSIMSVESNIAAVEQAMRDAFTHHGLDVPLIR